VFKAAKVIAVKDLRIELRSKVVLNQILPFVAVVLIIFAFAFNKYPALLVTVAPGLYWVTALFSSLLALQRSFSLESENNAKDALILYGLDPAGIYIGKVIAVLVEMVLLEVFLTLGIVFLYSTHLHELADLAFSSIVGTLGILAVGVTFSAMTSASKAKETILPLLLLPVVAPVLLSGTKAWENEIAGKAGLGDPWVGLLILFAAAFLALGTLTFGSVLEE
jgi:heme exporter protein B